MYLFSRHVARNIYAPKCSTSTLHTRDIWASSSPYGSRSRSRVQFEHVWRRRPLRRWLFDHLIWGGTACTRASSSACSTGRRRCRRCARRRRCRFARRRRCARHHRNRCTRRRGLHGCQPGSRLGDSVERQSYRRDVRWVAHTSKRMDDNERSNGETQNKGKFVRVCTSYSPHMCATICALIIKLKPL